MLLNLLPMSSLGEGETQAIKVQGVDVLVCHVEGQFYAIHGQCSHARQSLATGKLSGFEIKCPLHGARFDVRSGACLAAPAEKPITRFPVILEAGKVCIDEEALKLVEATPKPKFGPI